MDGYRVEPEDLRSASGSIADAIGAADDLNLESAAGKGDDYGHSKVFAAASAFCSTWELGKQLLQQRSASAGQALNEAATMYEEQEHQGASQAKEAGATPSPSPGPAPTPPGAP